MLPLAANHRAEGWRPAVTPQWESTMSTWNNDGNVSSCLFQISMWGISSSLHTDWCSDKVERQTLRIPRADIYCDKHFLWRLISVKMFSLSFKRHLHELQQQCESQQTASSEMRTRGDHTDPPNHDSSPVSQGKLWSVGVPQWSADAVSVNEPDLRPSVSMQHWHRLRRSICTPSQLPTARHTSVTSSPNTTWTCCTGVYRQVRGQALTVLFLKMVTLIITYTIWPIK